MAFDRAAAKAAGYSDQEIDGFLKQNGTPVKAHFRVVGGAAPASVPARPDPSAPMDGGGASFATAWPAPGDTSAGARADRESVASNALSQIGGVARAVGPSLAGWGATAALGPEAGLPLKILLSGLAGGGADAGIQLARGERPGLSSVGRGGVEAAATGVGGILEKILGMVARAPEDLGAAAFAGTPARAHAGKPFVRTALREGLMPGPSLSFEGADKAKSLVSASHAAEDATVSNLITNGKPPAVAPVDLARKAAAAVADKYALSAAERAEMKDLIAETRSTYKNSAAPVGPDEILKLKRTSDSRATPTYSKAQAGQAVPVSALEQKYHKALADESRAWLRLNVPGLGRQMQRTSELINVEKPLRWAEGQPVVAPREGGVAMARDLLATRENLGKMALSARGPAAVAAHPVTRITAGQLPRGAETIAALLQALSEQGQH